MAIPAVLLGGAATALGAIGAAGAIDLYNNRQGLADRLQENIIFPPDLKSNVPFMSMEFQKYERRSINQQPFYSQVMKIRLPIPENLTERTALSYDNQSLGSAAGSIIEAASVGNINPALTAAAGVGVGALSNAGSIVQNFAPQGSIASAAGGIAQSAINLAGIAAQTLFGITTNPFQVTLFKSPEFRSHSFSWQFIPTSISESETLRNLVETLKYHSLPGISTAGAVFFSYPEILKINFRPSDTYLYKFKPCVVKNVTVNYAPNSPSFVRSSGAPTAIKITIDLQEIEIMTKADFLRNADGIFNSLSTRVTPTNQFAPRPEEAGG